MAPVDTEAPTRIAPGVPAARTAGNQPAPATPKGQVANRPSATAIRVQDWVALNAQRPLWVHPFGKPEWPPPPKTTAKADPDGKVEISPRAGWWIHVVLFALLGWEFGLAYYLLANVLWAATVAVQWLIGHPWRLVGGALVLILAAVALAMAGLIWAVGILAAGFGLVGYLTRPATD